VKPRGANFASAPVADQTSHLTRMEVSFAESSSARKAAAAGSWAELYGGPDLFAVLDYGLVVSGGGELAESLSS
jgi:hypothetical protein